MDLHVQSYRSADDHIPIHHVLVVTSVHLDSLLNQMNRHYHRHYHHRLGHYSHRTNLKMNNQTHHPSMICLHLSYCSATAAVAIAAAAHPPFHYSSQNRMLFTKFFNSINRMENLISKTLVYI